MRLVFLNFSRFKIIGEKIVEKAKKVSFPFFDGVPIYDVVLFFWRSIINGAITTRASAIAFSFFVALFPFIIFLFTIIPFIPIENFQAELFLLVQQIVPESTFPTIEDTVSTIIQKQRGGTLSIGFFMSLIFSTNGLVAMMNAFDATIFSIKRRTWWSQRLAAIMLLFILSVLIAIAIGLLTGGQKLINYLDNNDFLRDAFYVYFLIFVKWVITISLFFFAYAFLYYMAPAKKTKWRFISAGGTLATILSIFTIIGFTYYINNFSRYNIVYGSLGTLLIILLLIYVMSLILLIGFELNASIHEAHSKKAEYSG
ncbi:MAG: YihY/virulence factor BrkB family protein [Bacteroidales bacterium]|jgi:membrane protein|nr:YihY/virulence factor BrkB family protein [Bacteroidales bacterium]